MNNTLRGRITTGSIGIILFGLSTLAPSSATAADKKATSFGPTGVLGGVYPDWPKKPEAILVGGVEKGSPADGKLKANDVIVGIGGKKFEIDPRPGYAVAIDGAETQAAGGKLTLLLQSGQQVEIQLPVLGSYSPTAPYNCPKSDKIIEQTVERLLKAGKIGVSATRADLLGLMATGEKKHIDIVAKLIKEEHLLDIDPQKVEGFLDGTKVDAGAVTAGWGWGYTLITLGEYHLLTKDESVLPMIRTYALGLARGQDASGCWGHRMMTATSGNRLPGYAQMNQPSISNFMAMLIARKCGIKDPVLDRAIERSGAYVADHADKGGFGYGVGGPAVLTFNNNGTSGAAAICMSLMGNQQAAKYFSQCAATTYDGLTSGHANTFFNPLWTSLGAALSGPEVTQQFFKKSLWYYNSKRHWQGGFPGSEATGGVYSGQALLMYCLPRKALLITGREADPAIWVKGAEVAEVINRSKLATEDKSIDELLKLLDHPSPQVPAIAAHLLMERTHILKREKKADDITPKIMALLAAGTPRQRAGALACFGPRYQAPFAAPYLDKIGAILRDKKEPFQVRVAAASAVGSGIFAAAAHPYYNDVLALLMEERPDKAKDPFGHVDVRIGEALDGLCEEPFAAQLVSQKELLYKVSARLLEHKRQKARATGIKMLRGMPLEDMPLIGEKLMAAIENKDPSYQSYHNVQDTVAPGVEVLATLNIKEGLDVLLDNVLHAEGKWGFKSKMLYRALPLYKGNAKPYIARFEEHPNIAKGKNESAWVKLVKDIEADKAPKRLITFKEAMGKQR